MTGQQHQVRTGPLETRLPLAKGRPSFVVVDEGEDRAWVLELECSRTPVVGRKTVAFGIRRNIDRPPVGRYDNLAITVLAAEHRFGIADGLGFSRIEADAVDDAAL